MTTARALLLGLAAAALAACSQEAETREEREAEVDILPPDESVSTPTNDLEAGLIDTPPAENYIAPNPDTAIPAALHGRWGLTDADCDSERDDTKGLVTIAADRISFYEAIAVPDSIGKSTRTSIEGRFAFTGEGMAWSGPMIWSVEGNRLIRIDSERDARLEYSRCGPRETEGR